jgi:hypothetical protein
MRERFPGGVSLVVGLVFLLSAQAGTAQNARDDWKPEALSRDLLRSVRYSLADAPITSVEREQIYRQVDADLRSDGLVEDENPDKEREFGMGAHVGKIQLAEKGSEQILVRAPRESCGNGGCPLWIFVRLGGKLRVALATGGGALIMRKTVSHGYHDVTTVWHRGGGETGYKVYSWDGRKYVNTDCYITQVDAYSSQNQPVIKDCPYQQSPTSRPPQSGDIPGEPAREQRPDRAPPPLLTTRLPPACGRQGRLATRLPSEAASSRRRATATISLPPTSPKRSSF